MRDIVININHRINSQQQDEFELIFESKEKGKRASKKRHVVRSLANSKDKAPMLTDGVGLVNKVDSVDTLALKSYPLDIPTMTQAAFSVRPINGVLYLDNLPCAPVYYLINTNCPIVLSQAAVPLPNAEAITEQLYAKTTPSCTLTTTSAAANITLSGMIFFNELKLQCLNTDMRIQGMLAVNCLSGEIHTLWNPEQSTIRIERTMHLESDKGGVINQGVWDSLDAHCRIDMKFFHNQARGSMSCGILALQYINSVLRPLILTNEGYISGKRLEGHLSKLITTTGSQTRFDSAGVQVSKDLEVGGFFIHEDSAKYVVKGRVDIQAGGRFFAKRNLEIDKAECVHVRKNGFLGAKFSFRCPVENFITEEGSYHGCPGYTTLEISNTLSLAGETVPGYSMVVEANRMYTNLLSQQQQCRINVGEHRNAGIMSALNMKSTVGTFVNMPGASFIGDFVSIRGNHIENQGAQKALDFASSADFSVKEQAMAPVSTAVAYSKAYTQAGQSKEAGFIGATHVLSMVGEEVVNHGIIISKLNSTISAVSKITNLMDAYLLVYGTLNIKSQTVFLNVGNILAKNQIICSAKDWFKQLAGGRLSADSLQILSKRIEHSGFSTGEKLELEALSTLEQYVDGQISATQAITLLAGETINRGVIECCGQISIVVQTLVQNQAKISATESLVILCGSVLRHAAELKTTEECLVLAKKLLENIMTTKPLDTSALESLTHFAVENAGLLSGQTVNILDTSRAWVKNLKEGLIQADKLKMSGAKLQNAGAIKSSQATLNYQALIEISETGLIETKALLELMSDTVNNQGTLTALQNLSIQAKRLKNGKEGRISGQASLALMCATLLENAGEISSQNIRIVTALLQNIQSGKILSQKEMQLIVEARLVNSGTLSAQKIHIMPKAMESFLEKWGTELSEEQKTKSQSLREHLVIQNLNTGRLKASEALTILAESADNAGHIEAGNARLHFETHYTQSGTLTIEKNLSLEATKTITLLKKSKITTKAALSLLAKQQIFTQGDILAYQALTIITDTLNSTGKIQGQDIHLTLSDWILKGNVQAQKELIVHAKHLIEIMETGFIDAKDVLELMSDEIQHYGTITALKDISIQAKRLMKTFKEGRISGQAGLALTCGTLLENAGEISAYQDIRIVAQQLLQNLESGKILSQKDIQLILETHFINAGTISAKQLKIMREAMESFLVKCGTEFTAQQKTESQNLREHLVIQNLSSGRIQASDALMILAEKADNFGHLEAGNARLYVENFSQSGSLEATQQLSIEASATITLLKTSKITAKEALSLLAKQKVFTQGDILAYQSLVITTDTLEHVAGKIEGHELIQLTVANWILKANIAAQKHLIAKIKNTWDWQAEGTFSTSKEGAVSLELDRGYTFTRPITLDATLNLKCEPTAVFHNLSQITVGSLGIYGGTFRNGTEHLAAHVHTTGKYIFDGVQHHNIQGALYAQGGFDITAPQGIVNGSGNSTLSAAMTSPSASVFRGTTSNRYSHLTVGPNSQFLSKTAQDALINLSGYVTITGKVSFQGKVTNTMLYQVTTGTDGVTRGRALSACPTFAIHGDLILQGMFETVGGDVWIGGATCVSGGGFRNRPLEIFDAWSDIDEIPGKRRGGIAGWLGKRHPSTFVTVPRHVTHNVHNATFTHVGPTYSLDACIFDYTSVRMEGGMVGKYQYFRVHQPFDTTKLPAHIRAKMGLFAKSLHLEGAPNSVMEFNSQQYIAEDFIVYAPEGSFIQREGTREAQDLARVNKTFVPQSVLKSNPGTGYTQVGGSVQMLLQEFHRTGGELSYGKDSAIIACLMETGPLCTTAIHNGSRTHTIAPNFTPAFTQGQANLHVKADTIVGNAHYKVKGKITFEYTRMMVLKLVAEYYQLPAELKKTLFQEVHSGGMVPMILGNIIDASLGVTFISASGKTELENTLFPSGQPVFQVPLDKLQRTFHYPEEHLYSHKRLTTVAQLGAVALAGAVTYVTGGILSKAMLPAIKLGTSAALTAKTILIGAAQGAVSSGAYTTLTGGNIAKSLLQGALLGGLGSGLSHKLQAMQFFEKVPVINPEVLRQASTRVAVAMAESGLNKGKQNLLKLSAFALAKSLVQSTLASTVTNKLSPLEAIQQEVTHACITGMIMAIITGANKKQAMNIGLQSAGFAVASLAGEGLAKLVESSFGDNHDMAMQRLMMQSVKNEIIEENASVDITEMYHNVVTEQSSKTKEDSTTKNTQDTLSLEQRLAALNFKLQGEHREKRPLTFQAPSIRPSVKNAVSTRLQSVQRNNGTSDYDIRGTAQRDRRKVASRIIDFFIPAAHAEEGPAADLPRLSPQFEDSRSLFAETHTFRFKDAELRRALKRRTPKTLQNIMALKRIMGKFELLPDREFCFHICDRAQGERRGLNRTARDFFPKNPVMLQDDPLEATVKVYFNTDAGHVVIEFPVRNKNTKRLEKTIFGLNPVDHNIKTALGTVPGKIDIEPDDVHLDSELLIKKTISITEAERQLLEEDMDRLRKDPPDYTLSSVWAENCNSVIVQKVVRLGFPNGFDNLFGIEEYQKTKFALIKLQMNATFNEYKEQRMLAICGSEDIEIYWRYKKQLETERLKVESMLDERAHLHKEPKPWDQFYMDR